MKATNYDNQAPIFRFLNKHKWRIILPLLFAMVYWAYPRYNYYPIAVQQNLFFKSNVFGKEQMNKEILEIRGQILSNEFLLNLISKYDLYKKEKEENIAQNLLLEKIRNSIEIRLSDENLETNSSLFVWICFRKENAENITALSDEVTNQFENNSNLQVNKYVSKSYDANSLRNWVFFGALMQGFVMLVIPLILLWEIPNLFYSPKTKKSVFEPIKSDWQNELYEAKLRGETLKAFQINLRYSFAFLSAMMQKSPIGDLIEFVRKIAS